MNGLAAAQGEGVRPCPICLDYEYNLLSPLQWRSAVGVRGSIVSYFMGVGWEKWKVTQCLLRPFFLPFFQCRFYAIVRPLAASKATRFMKYFLAAAWIMAAVSASPQVRVMS